LSNRIVAFRSLRAALCVQARAIYVKCIQRDRMHNGVIVVIRLLCTIA